MKLLSLALITHSLSFAQSSNLYDLRDLSLLEKEGNFKEFLAHVNDVRPSERQADWQSMYQSMTLALIDHQSKTNSFSDDDFKQIEKHTGSPALLKNTRVQLSRDQYARRFFNLCYQNAHKNAEHLKKDAITKCDNALNSYWFLSRKDPEVAVEIAKMLDQYNSGLNTWPFYLLAITDSSSPIYCRQIEVQRAIFNRYTAESFSENFDGDYKKLVRQNTTTGCFNEIVDAIKATALSNEVSSVSKELALNILSANNKLSSDDEDLLALIYLIDAPVVGDKMNLAWKRIESLGQNYQRRSKALQSIKKLDIIPDKTFQAPQLARNKAIINLLQKNIPEFLNFYGDGCIRFLSNTNESPGNIASTYQCRQFLGQALEVKKSDNIDWVSDQIQTQYSGLKR